MRTSVAVISIVLLGSDAACTVRDTAGADVVADPAAPISPRPALDTCHRAGEPTSRARGTRPEEARKGRSRVALPSRTRRLDLAQLVGLLAARMPDQDAAFHLELASTIDEEALLAGLDPLLVLALIHVESSFDPDAVSYAGAVGLMQLRERTLRSEIQRAGLPPADPRDPVANVRAGIRYLRRLVRAFGSTDLALMAYNAGPNRILTYHRAGEIPERFHVYPQRIRRERERLHSAVERRLRAAATVPSAGTAS
jgi:hypothetical protein